LNKISALKVDWCSRRHRCSHGCSQGCSRHIRTNRHCRCCRQCRCRVTRIRIRRGIRGTGGNSRGTSHRSGGHLRLGNRHRALYICCCLGAASDSLGRWNIYCIWDGNVVCLCPCHRHLNNSWFICCIRRSTRLRRILRNSCCWSWYDHI